MTPRHTASHAPRSSEPAQGAVHPERLRALLARWIGRLELDLRDLVVVTEAGTNHFALTAVLAAHAGASRVYTVSRDSRWGSADSAHAAVENLRRALGAPDRIVAVGRPEEEALERADLVTNLGWVRPLDALKINRMRPGAAIAAMCESWEVRPGDIDRAACARRGIPVVGVNEDHPWVDVFVHNGLLAVKMLQQLQIEIHATPIAIIGRDKFAARIAATLSLLGAEVRRSEALAGEGARRAVEGTEALVIADYARTDRILGAGGDMTVDQLLKLAPHAAVVQFAGWIQAPALRAAGIRVFPEEEIGPKRMGRTLAFLGPGPLVGLHAAGLKAGAMALGRSGPAGLMQRLPECGDAGAGSTRPT
jgi:hypothetical protein